MTQAKPHRVQSFVYHAQGSGKICNFEFNGQPLQGRQGDTLASALLANGINLIGRGMKFHRPRGILSAGAEESNALVTVGEGGRATPGIRATLQPLRPGLIAHSQNCWPGPKWDVGGVLNALKPLFPAGFYNKTFIWPSWHWFESVVRSTAGLGKLPTANDPDHYQQQHLHTDVLVVGAGPSGITAALAAAKKGARVTLVEQSAVIGGSLLSAPVMDALQTWLSLSLAQLNTHPNIDLHLNTTLSGLFDHGVAMASTTHSEGPWRETLLTLRCQQIVLATGALEQPLPFVNNDRPGIMLASAAAHYLNRHGVLVGQRIALATNNDSIYSLLAGLKQAGADIVAVIDTREQINPVLKSEVKAVGAKLLLDSMPAQTYGYKQLQRIDIARCYRQSPEEPIVSLSERRRSINCDTLLTSGGWQPAVHLYSQAKGKLRYQPEYNAFIPVGPLPQLQVIGGAKGILPGLQLLQHSYQGGADAASQQDKDIIANAREVMMIDQLPDWWPEQWLDASSYQPRFTLALKHKPQRQWLDFQHDVVLADIALAVREGYTSVEHLKRYTTTGMSVDQGKTSNINTLLALACLTHREVGQVGTTTFRPFYLPLTLGAIAARQHEKFYSPTRRSPLHDWQQQHGAHFWDYGHWQRPAAYPKPGESLEQAMQREAKTVRKSVGCYDGSPLGKIEVSGPDAAEFLNRFYLNNVLTLKIGKARYGLMLNENGIIIDDGIVARLDEQRYLVHTTSGNANQIFAWMEEWHQCEWRQLDVVFTQVTTQWANIAISGPNARRVLLALDTTIDLDNNHFPHMSIAEGELITGQGENIPLRIMRASFTGELGFELNIPAAYGLSLWQALQRAGEPYGICPYGVESLMILRTEKGYLHVGADTDGNTTPADIGWGPVAAKKAADFIGKRSLARPYNQEPDRFALVGIEPVDKTTHWQAGAHLIANDSAHPGKRHHSTASQGYITSAFFSPHLKRTVALGLVAAGNDRLGEEITVYQQGTLTRAKLVPPSSIDPKGDRLHV